MCCAEFQRPCRDNSGMGLANERWCYIVCHWLCQYPEWSWPWTFLSDGFQGIYIYSFAFNWIFWLDEVLIFWAIPINRGQGLLSDFISINFLKIYWMDNAEYSFEYEKNPYWSREPWVCGIDYIPMKCVFNMVFCSPKYSLKTHHISPHVGL